MEKGSITEMLKEMQPGEDPVILTLPSTEECCSYSTLASRYNRIKGYRYGKYIHVSIDYQNKTVYLVCTTYDEYVKEKNHVLPKQWWKEKIKNRKTLPFSYESHQLD